MPPAQETTPCPSHPTTHTFPATSETCIPLPHHPTPAIPASPHLCLERDAWSMCKWQRQATNERAPLRREPRGSYLTTHTSPATSGTCLTNTCFQTWYHSRSPAVTSVSEVNLATAGVHMGWRTVRMLVDTEGKSACFVARNMSASLSTSTRASPGPFGCQNKGTKRGAVSWLTVLAVSDAVSGADYDTIEVAIFGRKCFRLQSTGRS